LGKEKDSVFPSGGPDYLLSGRARDTSHARRKRKHSKNALSHCLPKWQSNRVTLIELLSFLVCVSIGAITSIAVYHIGGFWLAIPGFILGFLSIPFLAFSYNRYRKWVYLGDTWMPDCSCGSNKFKYEKIGDEYHLLCQECGAKYKRERHIIWIYENNEKRIYKRMVKFKGWQ
jgi:hypothetical protein